MKDRFLIVKNIKEFIFSIDKLVINLPRRELVIRDKLLSESMCLLEIVYIANGSKSRDEMLRILSKISMLDFYLEYLHKKGVISEKLLKKYSNMLSNISKMVYGWLKVSV